MMSSPLRSEKPDLIRRLRVVCEINDRYAYATQQIAAVLKRLLSNEAERVALERSIREEVAAEMKEHLETTEAEIVARLEMERCVRPEDASHAVTTS